MRSVERPFDNLLLAVSRVHHLFILSRVSFRHVFSVVPSCIVHSFPDFLSSLNHAVELNKQISCTLQLTNKTDKQVTFKVKRILSCAFPGRRSQPRETKWYRTRSGLSLCDAADCRSRQRAPKSTVFGQTIAWWCPGPKLTLLVI